jgi:transketolase
MRTAFVKSLENLMDNHEEIIIITADIGYSVFEGLQRKFPKRFFNTGITEQSSVSLASGLALSGYTVFFYAQAPFATMRCFEQIRLDVAYNNLNVKIIGTAAGYSSNQLGVSHFALEDVGLMRLLPNMKIYSPGDPIESAWATKSAYENKGPAYIRLTKSGSPIVHQKEIHDPKNGIVLKEGKDIAILVSGSLLPSSVEVSNILRDKGINAKLISFPQIKPLNEKVLVRQIKDIPYVFTIEEHLAVGGFGTAVTEILMDAGVKLNLLRFGAPDKFTPVTGSIPYLLNYNGLSTQMMIKRIENFMSKR